MSGFSNRTKAQSQFTRQEPTRSATAGRGTERWRLFCSPTILRFKKQQYWSRIKRIPLRLRCRCDGNMSMSGIASFPIHALIRMSMCSLPWTKKPTTPASFPWAKAPRTIPITWYKNYDGGRYFYTSLGHTYEDYRSDRYFRALLTGAIEWAGGRSAGSRREGH